MNQDPRPCLPAFIVPSQKEIAVLAYQMYLMRGASNGRDRDDWLRAEQELKIRRDRC